MKIETLCVREFDSFLNRIDTINKVTKPILAIFLCQILIFLLRNVVIYDIIYVYNIFYGGFYEIIGF